MPDHPTAYSTMPADDADEISLLDLLNVIVENLRLLIIGPLLAGLAALGVGFMITPTFTASTVILPPQQQQSMAASLLQSVGALGGAAGALAGIKNPNDQYIALLKSRGVQDALIERFGLLARYEEEFVQDARKALEQRVKISSGKDGLITIEVDDHDPVFAAQLANAHVEELKKILSRLAVTEAQQRRLFFERRLEEAKTRLVQAEQALQATGVNAGTLKINPETAIRPLAQLQASVAAQEVKLAAMRSYLAENAPELRQALAELGTLRAQLRRAEDAQPAADAANADYVAKYRDFKYSETLFELMAKQYEIARVDESREGPIIQVVDPALPPERKSKPKKALIAVVTTLAVGMLLLLFVFVRRALRNAAQDPEGAAKLNQLRASWSRALGRGG